MTNLYNIYKYDTALQDVQPFFGDRGDRGVEKPCFLSHGLKEGG